LHIDLNSHSIARQLHDHLQRISPQSSDRNNSHRNWPKRIKAVVELQRGFTTHAPRSQENVHKRRLLCEERRSHAAVTSRRISATGERRV